MDERQLLARLMAHRVFAERMVARLSRVAGFESLGLANDLAQYEAALDQADLPEDVIEAMADELRSLFEAVQTGRGHAPQ